MKRISRRDLLRGGLAAGAALATADVAGSRILRSSTEIAGRRSAAEDAVRFRRAVQASARRSPGSLPYPTRTAGTDTMPQIEHILVLMMENHSYDNHLGMLGRGSGQTPRGDGFTIGGNGLPTASNPYADGSVQHAFHMPTDCQVAAKPSQAWLASHEQYDTGTCRGFVTSPSGPVAMGYWDQEDLPFYYSLASSFPVADRWFCSLLGQTTPNRRYLIAGTSVGMVDDIALEHSTGAPNGTVFDMLSHYGISWRNYFHTDTTCTAEVFLSDPALHSGNLVSIDSFFTDCASGTLPGFAVIDPNFGSGSEENPQDIAHGEAFAAQVVNAVMSSPAWSSTLLVWTFDEHGGYYDHVPPPAAIPPDSIAPLPPTGEPAYTGFGRYGFRVPAVVISPFAIPDHVSSVVHDHTSVLAMVERKWNLPALTYRDANANDLTDLIDLSSTPSFLEPPVLAAPATFPQACATTGAGTIPPPTSVSPVP
ncbi:MAG: alkaline phosphatase family protein [Acidimicrobiales bacterium]